MKCLSILVVMFITVAPAKLSFGQTQTSTQTPQTSPNKTAASGSKHHKKTTNNPNTAATNNATPDKPGGKVATTPTQDAAYALSGNKSAPEAAPHPPKQ
jgi:hypothetical protein